MTHTIKLNEEVGELCEAVLKELDIQRQDKLDSYNRNDLGEKCADVILTLLLRGKGSSVTLFIV